MAIEIELKAHVEKPDECAAALSGIAEFLFEFKKDDTYWKMKNTNAQNTAQVPDVRIRKEYTKNKTGEKRFVLVTYKTKNIVNGIEVNNEKEFALCDVEVDNAAAGSAVQSFEELLSRFGLAPSISKNKNGRAWNYNGITAELSLVQDLGWFVELEIISDSNDGGTVARSKERLLHLLHKLNIGDDAIEPRYYTEMLISLDNKKNGKNEKL
ncbi:hypothetical protein FACS1894190_16140 [Spirochaetia bacterium]|nr:hypothetical protein FACS1894190_16140 [Spirochaetia bacterium]